ncbi:hypothetical protein L0666_16365 [Octadecabacter sp. CECT 8868]|uniref:hypothetical protein n=1 Tax=Octadecabacter algicola TaxID=2909342 RepID=UPI001F2AE140|nr:hypothetical protein [Octadecabacter algicola]MCF2906568.1 hypothetical protein [Octadecabacter algicola]MCF2906569.1 hypothetical protein [Octadecabacter algicola]
MFKSVPLALAAIAASATIASADVSYLSNFAEEQTNDKIVELGTVRSAGDGVVEIYSYNAGQIGDLLGTQAVHEGANANVDVNITSTRTDAIALLKVNGQVVDSQEIDFN